MGSPLDDTLRETPLGAFIARHKWSVMGLIGVVFLGLFAFGAVTVWRSWQQQQYGDRLFAFWQNEWPQFEQKQLTAEALLDRYRELTEPMGGHRSLAYQNLRLVDRLKEKGVSDGRLIPLLEWGPLHGRNPYTRYLYGTRLSVLHENEGRYRKAIESLESLLGQSVRPLEEKIYLDLGRLQLLIGKEDKARASLRWVLDTAADPEIKKMAQFYLGE